LRELDKSRDSEVPSYLSSKEVKELLIRRRIIDPFSITNVRGVILPRMIQKSFTPSGRRPERNSPLL